MIVRTLDEIIGTERVVKGETWISRRLLLQADGMGFSFHDTLIFAGMEIRICYKNHLEAVYCIEGHGTLEALSECKTYHIKAGTLYALNAHDLHIIRATTDMRLISVFNPALVGLETHDQEGSYPLLTVT